MFHKLNNCFDQEQKKCSAIAMAMISEAKAEGTSFNKDLRQEWQIVNYQKLLDFFLNNQLLNDTNTRIRTLQDFISKSIGLINDAKQYASMDEMGKHIFE